MEAAKVLRKTVRQLSLRQRAALYTLVSRLPLGNMLLRWCHDSSIDAYLLSFPQCGCTWLRVMLEYALVVHFSLENTELLKSNILLGTPDLQMPTKLTPFI